MKINKYIVILILSILFNKTMYSQNDKVIIKEFVVDDGDTILLSNVPSVEIISFKNVTEKVRYAILKRKVLKVYPYAIYTKDKLKEIEINLNVINRKSKKKKYIREVSRFLKEELGKELKKLTKTEGNILVKLIYRETKISTYKLLKQYRGSINAFFWQTMARIYDNDLKQEYDPVNNREDMLIEHIIINAKLEGKL